MITKIQHLKELGFSKKKVAKALQVSRNTVSKYWNLDIDQYMEMKENYKKSSLLDQYREIILNWLINYPDMTSAQVLDWLKESYADKACTFIERSVSRGVKQLRENYDIPKSKVMQREYDSVLELPMGYQVQVDFGQKYMLTANNTRQKVYFVIFVLSHSRYKWGYFLDRPFTTPEYVS